MLTYGIALIPVISVRIEPDHYSQLTTQLLFGEIYKVTQEHEDWYFIETLYDNYKGWIQISQHTSISEQEYHELAKKQKKYIGFPMHMIREYNNKFALFLSMGSIIYDVPNLNIAGISFNINEKALFTPEQDTGLSIVNLARKCLNMPFLWGGKSIMGFDCSGFVQIIYRMHNILLPRNAYQQATVGIEVKSLSEAIGGDLAFFGKKQIGHVGILTGQGTIIHCSGLVSEDIIDEHGIKKAQTNQYTHHFNSIRRVIQKFNI